MGNLRIWGLLGGIGLLAAAAIWLSSLMDKAREVDGWRACARQAEKVEGPLDSCGQAIRNQVTIARRAAACEAALLGQRQHGTELFTIRAACGEEVKRLHAVASAAAADLADARRQLDAADAQRAAAVARAEARALSTADRKAKDDRTLDALAPGADGRIRCDAECLRDLAGH